MLAAFVGAVDTRGKSVVHLRLPRGLRHLRRAGKIHFETVLRVDVFGPFLRSRRARYRKQQDANECRHTHDVSSLRVTILPRLLNRRGWSWFWRRAFRSRLLFF